MGKHKGRSGGKWRDVRARFRRLCEEENRPCHLCGQPIDYKLPWPDRWCWTADHIIPLAQLPENDRRREAISNLLPAHFRCNTSKGDGLRNKWTVHAPPVSASSRPWIK